MRKIGLIGGMSWHSTAGYYRIINEAVAAALGGHSSARIVLESVDFAEIRDCQTSGDWARSGQLLAQAAQRCEQAGADVVMICTNLMHKNAPEVSAAVQVPLLHIGEAIASRVTADGFQTIGLLGTKWTMEQDFYRAPLAAAGIGVVTPVEEDRALVDQIIWDELTFGIVREDSRKEYVRVIEDLVARGAEVIVLGCTEIELLIGPEDVDVPVLDSMRTHAEAAAAFALAGEPVQADASPMAAS